MGFLKECLSNWTPTRSPQLSPVPTRQKDVYQWFMPQPFCFHNEIAKEKKISSPSYLIQSWMRSNAMVEYLRMWEKVYNPGFQEHACDDLIHTVHSTSTMLTLSLATHAIGMKASVAKVAERLHTLKLRKCSGHSFFLNLCWNWYSSTAFLSQCNVKIVFL